MASLVYYLRLALFHFMSISSLQIQARENLFFSKAVRNEPFRETSSLTNPEDLYYEENEKLQPKTQIGYGLNGLGPHQFLPTETGKVYHDNKKDDVPYVSPRFSNNEFTTVVFENSNSIDRYGSRSVPTETTSNGYNGGMYKKQHGYVSDRGSSQRYQAYKGYDSMRGNTEGYGAYNGDVAKSGNYGYGGYREKSFEYKNGMGGYQTNHKNQEDFVP